MDFRIPFIVVSILYGSSLCSFPSNKNSLLSSDKGKFTADDFSKKEFLVNYNDQWVHPSTYETEELIIKKEDNIDKYSLTSNELRQKREIEGEFRQKILAWRKSPIDDQDYESYVKDGVLNQENEERHQFSSHAQPGAQVQMNPSDIKYTILAQKALNSYIQKTDRHDYKLVKVTRVTEQSVAGVVYRIEFTISSSTGDGLCNTEIWQKLPGEGGSLEIENIKCTVNENGKPIPGGLTKQDPTEPEYKKLAWKSLKKFLHETVNTGMTMNDAEIVVTDVTTQVVSGIKTRLSFIVYYGSYSYYNCRSSVWEQPWISFEKIEVKCSLIRDPQPLLNSRNTANKLKKYRYEQKSSQYDDALNDPNSPLSLKMARESWIKFVMDTHILGLSMNKIDFVVKFLVTTLIAGKQVSLILFEVNTLYSEPLFLCSSALSLDQSANTIKVIGVRCDCTKKNSGGNRRFGGPVEKNPSDIKYAKLAQKALNLYIQKTHNNNYKLSKVTRVTEQSVAGVVYRIEFTISSSTGDGLCNTKILQKLPGEGGSLKIENIICTINENGNPRPGGLIKQDPTKPEYKKLAWKSLKKFLHDTINTGMSINDAEIVVTDVTTQVVSGIITRLSFIVYYGLYSYYSCHSSVLDQPWLSLENIDVKCSLIRNPQPLLISRNTPLKLNTYNEKNSLSQYEDALNDPNSLLSLELAQESLLKFFKDTGYAGLYITNVDLVITFIDTKIIAGKLLTSMIFDVNSHDSRKIFECFSAIYLDDSAKPIVIGESCLKPNKN